MQYLIFLFPQSAPFTSIISLLQLHFFLYTFKIGAKMRRVIKSLFKFVDANM